MPARQEATTSERSRRGYNRRSRSEHPGVTIASEKRPDGSTVVVLRWTHPGTKRRCKETVKDFSGRPISSRERAKAAAVAKSKEIAGERRQIEEGKAATDRDITWEALKKKHATHLSATGRSRKSNVEYAKSWKYLERWPGLPARPFKLVTGDLEDFVHFLRHQRNQYTGAMLAPASIETTARHVKAILNFGRRSLSCVRIDGESINHALDTGLKHQLEPVAYSTAQLKTILEKAIESDELVERGRHLFPLLATFMLTGCRRGELERLRWFQSSPGKPESYVDFDGRRLVVWSTKTRRHRHVPFRARPSLRKLLEAMAKEVDTNAEPFVFGGPKALAVADRREAETRTEQADREDEGKVRGRSLKIPLKNLREACGFPFTLKGLRSTLATYLANSQLGLNLYQVAAELGHNYAVLDKHYAKRRELPRKQEWATTIESLLGVDPIIDGWLKGRSKVKGKVPPRRRRTVG